MMGVDRVSNLWTDLQRSNRLPKGVLASTCEVELRELMEQIDQMFNSNTTEWKQKMQSLKAQLELKEKECTFQKTVLDQKLKEILCLHEQLESTNLKQVNLVDKYETQLSHLKMEAQKLKNDYEKLCKKYQKKMSKTENQKGELTSGRAHCSAAHVQRLTQKLEEYGGKSKDWEFQKKALHKKLESLESEKRELNEKYEMTKLRADDYQKQLDKRQHILDSTEISFTAQMAQWKSQLEQAKSEAAMQSHQKEKFQMSLEQLTASYKNVKEEKSKLLEKLRQTNCNIKALEDHNISMAKDYQKLKSQLDELERKKLGREETEQLQEAASQKEIQNLKEEYRKRESEQVENLNSARDEIIILKELERTLRVDIAQATLEVQTQKASTKNLDDLLKIKKEELQLAQENNFELERERAKISQELKVTKNSYREQLDELKVEASTKAAELGYKEEIIASLNEKISLFEKQLREKQDNEEKKAAELQVKVANSQMEVLRTENHHLNQSLLNHLDYDSNAKEVAEKQLEDLSDEYTSSITRLKNDNLELHKCMMELEARNREMEQEFRDKVQDIIKKAENAVDDIKSQHLWKVQKIEQDSEKRIHLMKDQLQTSSSRYEERIKALLCQKSILEEQLAAEQDLCQRIEEETDVLTRFTKEVDNIVQSAPVKHESVLHRALSVDNLDYSDFVKSNNLSGTATQVETLKLDADLENIFDGHLKELCDSTVETLQKYAYFDP